MQVLISKLHQIQDNDLIRKISQYIFCLAVLIEVAIVLVDKSQLTNPIEGRLFQITFALCLLKVVCTKYELREYILIAVFCILGLAVDFFGDRNELLRAFMFVAAFKGTDLKKCLKAVFWATLIGCLIIVFLSLTGIFGDIQVNKMYDGGSPETPYYVLLYCFGMGNPNAFHIMIFALTLLGLYVYADRIKLWMGAGLLVLDAVLFYLCRCRTATLMLALAAAAFLVLKYSGKRLKRIIDKICLAVSLFAVGVSIFFASLGEEIFRVHWIEPDREHNLLYILDELLTGRILTLVETENWDGAIESWTWFTVPNHERYFDLGFVRLFYWYGIIPAAIILLVFLVLYIWLIKKEKHEELVFLTVIAVFTIVEAHFVSVYIGRCYPLFILGGFWTLPAKSGAQVSIARPDDIPE